MSSTAQRSASSRGQGQTASSQSYYGHVDSGGINHDYSTRRVQRAIENERHANITDRMKQELHEERLEHLRSLAQNFKHDEWKFVVKHRDTGRPGFGPQLNINRKL